MFTILTYKNDVFRSFDENEKPSFASESTSIDEDGLKLILNLRKLGHRKISENKFGDISSFNFSRDVFNSGDWNDLSKIARGLFMDTRTGEIIARGYEKFFAHNERKFNSDAFLIKNLTYPVSVYEKYNGFLGILGVFQDKLLFCTKSRIDGIHCQWFKEIFENHLKESGKNIDEYETNLAKYLKDNNLCLVFEVIDPINDPHIVKYDKADFILLDAIKRQAKFECLDYQDLQKFAEDWSLKCKAKICELNSIKEVLDVMKDYEDAWKPEWEGAVFVDSSGYHMKVKGSWYKTWKFLRGKVPQIASGHPFSTSGFTTPGMNLFLAFCRSKDREYLSGKSIIDLRQEFNEWRHSDAGKIVESEIKI